MLKTVKLHQKPQYVPLVEIICKYSCISKIFIVHLFLQYFDDTGDAGIHTLLLNRFVSYSSEYQYYLLHCLHFPLIDHQVSELHQPFRIHTIHKGNFQRISDCLSKLCQCHALPYSLASGGHIEFRVQHFYDDY